MASTLVPLLHALRVFSSAYDLYLASVAINNLLGYEETAKKAAKVSNVAESQLHKTRTTQASGTIAMAATFVSSVVLLILPFVPSIVVPEYTTQAVAVANALALLAARKHVGDFWKRKFKVPAPGVGDYNEAIAKTQEIRLSMLYLVASWGVTALLATFL